MLYNLKIKRGDDMVRVILQFDGDITEFEKRIGSMDDEFDFYDSLYYQLDYGAKGEVGTHNGINIIVEENDWEEDI